MGVLMMMRRRMQGGEATFHILLLSSSDNLSVFLFTSFVKGRSLSSVRSSSKKTVRPLYDGVCGKKSRDRRPRIWVPGKAIAVQLDGFYRSTPVDASDYREYLVRHGVWRSQPTYRTTGSTWYQVLLDTSFYYRKAAPCCCEGDQQDG